MTPELFNQIKANCEEGEGRIPHFYLDTMGNVTVGVGHLVPSPAAAVKLNMTPAESVVADFNAVAAAEMGLVASHYAPLTKSRMSEETIDALLTADITACQDQLRSKFAFDAAPDPSQAGLTDMGFNLGVGGLTSKFPSFCAAFKAGDWASCAKECHRKDISDSRNAWTASQFTAAVNFKA